MRDKSLINPELSIDEVLEEMILHVVENQVRAKPHISVLSKRQLWFGNGFHFKNAEKHINAGLRKNLGIRIPSNDEIEKKNLFYGYNALIKPWAELNNITNRIMRTKILKKTVDEKELKDIRVLLGRGYIRKDGTIDPNQTKGISVYILFMADVNFRQIQNEWISKQPEWKRRQIARNQHTHYDILKEKKAAASALVLLNKKLIEQDEWKQLDAAVDMGALPWNEDD